MINYIVMGEVDDEVFTADVKKKFEDQGPFFKTIVEFQTWKPGAPAVGLRKESADLALLSAGTAARLKVRDLGQGLAEVRKALRSDGRVLIIANEEDEDVLGGKLEVILEAQDLKDLRDLEGVRLGTNEAAPGQVLRDSGLRLLQVFRDECGLAIGVCARREDKAKKLAAAKARDLSRASSSASSEPRSRTSGSGSGGKPRSRSSR
ncbi:unnamed protein product [Polarella glacialis]|uniref:Uncharacterized protein n=1 Tax=Polarella glacialis TaxID=89957 RepID=A0A813LQ67_POLGL|nr:unnamed protein product [Polarella glacialis]